MPDLTAQYAQGMAQLTQARLGQMLNTCTVVRPAVQGQTPVLDADGNPTAAAGTTVYDGPCVVAQPAPAPLRGRSSNDQAGVPEQRELRVPHSADLRSGDHLTVTASTFSPGLVGDVFVIIREDERSYATYRKFILRGSSWLSPEVGP